MGADISPGLPLALAFSRRIENPAGRRSDVPASAVTLMVKSVGSVRPSLAVY